MKAIGIIRRIDDLGRIVIPQEIRRATNIEEGDPLEVFVDDDYICLKKYWSSQNFKEKLQKLVNDFNGCDEYYASEEEYAENLKLLKKIKELLADE